MLVVSGSFLGMTFQDTSHLIILLILMISVEAGDVKPVGLCPFILISSSNQMMFLGGDFPRSTNMRFSESDRSKASEKREFQ